VKVDLNDVLSAQESYSKIKEETLSDYDNKVSGLPHIHLEEDQELVIKDYKLII